DPDADIEFLVQDAILGTAVTVDSRRRPRPAARSGFSGGVQGVGDGARGFPSSVTLEDLADHACLVRVDRQLTLGGQVVTVAPAAAAEAVFDASDKASAGSIA